MGSKQLRVDANGWIVDDDAPRPMAFGAVVGENVQRIRTAQGMTQTALAKLLSANGDPWTKGNVASLERGARPRITDAELAQLAGTLNVPLPSLYEGSGEMRTGAGTTIKREAWREALSGRKPPTLTIDDPDALVAHVSAGPPDFVAFEIADRLGVTAHAVATAAAGLFGHSATVEHARRVGTFDDPTSQSAAVKRGNVTRQLVDEINVKIRETE
ncbi:helix-turn-helix domain-containing protein [Labedaea rhizosphaerae]|uniref:Helix-turn-helix protein n=1 Tax=Labedaea rhizosphaerae TaxID=598644 RepID=A0A4R6RVQ4_LABRH|nr:helix-turn-helix domain-containing protein [Labedaea rhizosphaerae]TDP90507.1 helix-turn-helix protein [Labedaea rhizosphaerae]